MNEYELAQNNIQRQNNQNNFQISSTRTNSEDLEQQYNKHFGNKQTDEDEIEQYGGEIEDDNSNENKKQKKKLLEKNGQYQNQQQQFQQQSNHNNNNHHHFQAAKIDPQLEEKEKNFKRYFGNNIVFCKFNNEPLFTLGPHWPAFICTFCVIAITGYSITEYVAIQKGTFFYYGEILITILLLLSYFMTAIINPGIHTARSYKEFKSHEKSIIGYCAVCKVSMDNETYHCYDCEVCVLGYDHHCPWVGKCIGQGNICVFKFFIGFLCFFFVFSMFVSVAPN